MTFRNYLEEGLLLKQRNFLLTCGVLVYCGHIVLLSGQCAWLDSLCVRNCHCSPCPPSSPPFPLHYPLAFTLTRRKKGIDVSNLVWVCWLNWDGGQGKWEDSEHSYSQVIDRWWVIPQICISFLSFRWVLGFLKPRLREHEGLLLLFFFRVFCFFLFSVAHSSVLLIIIYLLMSQNRTVGSLL